jgi:hypothetical protein
MKSSTNLIGLTALGFQDPYSTGLDADCLIEPPVVASTIRRMVVINPKNKIAQDSTLLVGHFLIKGAIRIAPIHCAA